MATRQQRLDQFAHEGDPPADQPLELLCEDHVGSYVIPFPCRWSSGTWESVATTKEDGQQGWGITVSPLSNLAPIKPQESYVVRLYLLKASAQWTDELLSAAQKKGKATEVAKLDPASAPWRIVFEVVDIQPNNS